MRHFAWWTVRLYWAFRHTKFIVFHSVINCLFSASVLVCFMLMFIFLWALSLIQIKYVCKFGELLVLLRLRCLRSGESNQYACLASDQSTVCVECLFIFRIIIELVLSWLKLNVFLQTVHISALLFTAMSVRPSVPISSHA